MIIYLKGANFSSSNIGTLNMWLIQKALGSGASSSNSATSVTKGAAYNTTITIADGYELGSAGVSVTMGGTTVTSGITTNGNTITISIASVTGNVAIKVPTKNTATGEENSGSNGSGNGGSAIDLVINIEAGTLLAPTGKEDGATGRWRSADFIETSKITNTVSVAGSRYIISCYNSNKEYLGQVSKTNPNASYIIGSGQWQTSGTVINKSSLTADTAYVRLVFDASNIQILIDDVDCTGELAEPSAPNQGEATIYPFETGSLAKETGSEIASTTRWRMAETWALDKFGSKFTIQECTYAVCCWDANNKYTGQYDNSTKQIISGETITAAHWNLEASETFVTDLTTLNVAKIRLITGSNTANAHLYVDGNVITE